MRRAFGLPQVLLIILFIGGIVTVTMRYASLGAQHYADSYTREQAELFLQSATEATLLRISGYDRQINNTCIPMISINSADGRFRADINVTRYYLYQGKDNNGSTWDCDRIVSIDTPESHGMIDMTVVVTSVDNNIKILHPIRLERRSLQRP
ncbi:MAG: hypothetical protein AB7U44_10165 [Sulfuricurvum sp.]|uniref:hypothetical protein n=1 Tax=Sulfuricurvum sp. TaxID=2025608 RepID=UPI0026200786|nr:hypothetical protein [Sulfuricurvum sp.]MDD4884932.1 hypothetical protein [Sulfuricurvum sp.]